MGVLLLIFLTHFVTTICSAVLLIQIGGWLPILVAILSLIFYMLITGLLVISLGAEMQKRAGLKKQTEVKENESSSNP